MNYFYCENPTESPHLSSEESQHCIKVLRKKKGDQIELIDGKGSIFKCELVDENFRKSSFKVLSSEKQNPRSFKIHIAIAPTKNLDRIEWFVEKCCELGVDEISLVQTKRTERTRVKIERLDKKAISALKQSKNFFRCQVNELISLKNYLNQEFDQDQKFIAAVDKENPYHLFESYSSAKSVHVLIGPEGDFTNEELGLAQSVGFKKVSLGNSTLRTETAGVIAGQILTLKNELDNSNSL